MTNSQAHRFCPGPEGALSGNGNAKESPCGRIRERSVRLINRLVCLLACVITWIGTCQAAMAQCGQFGTGDCFVAHPDPFCDRPDCCELTCMVFPDCCIVEWDATCASFASVNCQVIVGGCAPDYNGDLNVDGADLGLLLASWLLSDPAIDLNGDGIVDGGDLGLLLAAWGPCEVLPQINEIRVGQPGDDVNEYVELAGPAGLSLSGMTYLAIRTDPNSSGDGTVEAAIPLAGKVIQPDGLFLIGSPTFSLSTPDLVANFSFTNDQNVTHRLVRNWTGATDIDEDENCVVDGAPWGELIDSIALREVGDSSCVYGPTFTQQLSIPSHIYRCRPYSGWRLGFADVTTGVDTPGAQNPMCCPGTGDCCNANGTPSCSDTACCNAVCTLDPFCCIYLWDGLCESQAGVLCGCDETVCPNKEHGCLQVGNPGCDDMSCCNAVCETKPACCSVVWDQSCVVLAQQICEAPPGDCCSTHAGLGCAISECEQLVCLADPSCCESGWDDLCVFEALKVAACGCTCGRIDFGVTPMDNSQIPPCSNDPSFEINTQFQLSQHIVFGPATGLVVPPVAIGLDGACSPQCRSAGLPFFSADWWCAFVQRDGTIDAGVTSFSAEICFINDPGLIVMEGFDVSMNLIAIDVTAVIDTEVLVITAPPGQLIRYVRVGGNGRQAGVSVDCLNYDEPLPIEPADCPPTDHACFESGGPGCTDSDCCGLICLVQPSCCEVAWDNSCVELAVGTALCLDDVDPSDTCPNGDHDCFTEGTPGCSNSACCQVICSVSPSCCLVQWDSTCVDFAQQICGGTADCCAPHNAPGCAVMACESAVCAVDPFCCLDSWDTICANEANELCPNLCGSDQVCPNLTHGCLEQGTPGCNDVTCCNAVCSADPFCCVVKWDAFCAESALTLCPDQCGGFGICPNPSHTCYQTGSPGCSTPECCYEVCSQMPLCCIIAWDSSCVTLAQVVCGCGNDSAPAVCGSPQAGPCTVPHPSPGCDDCECCEKVCNLDTFCCDVSWDTTCATLAALRCDQCGDLDSGDCCIAHSSPSCSDAECCCAVCSVIQFCCSISWDAVCAEVAAQLCGECNDCGDPGAGDCFVANGTPSCDSAPCCIAVCSQDIYCCDVKWDTVCALEALLSCAQNPTCDSAEGSCFAVHATPGCDQPGCCSLVCNVAPDCCGLEWDMNCVDVAGQVCESIGCGSEVSGDCFEAHESPFCNDTECCTAVCNVDSFCCDESWDSVCVSEAQGICDFNLSCPGAGQCFSVHTAPACNDESCCNIVCSVDGACCDTGWDEACVQAAIELCITPASSAQDQRSCFLASQTTSGCDDADCATLICSIDDYCCLVLWDAQCAGEAIELCSGPGECGSSDQSCYFVGVGPGCNNAACCTIVCSVDPFCCDSAWDHNCAVLAEDTCDTLPTCPGTGDCFSTHPSPSCNDPACCEAVCFVDPLCCQNDWDAMCVDQANELCKGESGCPCFGECFEKHDNPGCNDETCCNAVCELFDSYCCTTTWDAPCVAAALRFCCGDGGCGTVCAGSCLEVHPGPSCDDFKCCEAVCDEDPSCCDVTWDSSCVTLAEQRCTVCGSPYAGNCFDVSSFPACADLDCCTLVCGVDNFCCSVQWDSFCVDQANDLCSPPDCGENPEDCCIAHPTPSCSDQTCCEAVCDEDSFCCDTEWDQTCVNEALDLCGGLCPEELPCGDPCAGPCCEAKDTPNCDDPVCCAAVCAVDSFCCDVIWDAICANTAGGVCPDVCPGPECGDPFTGSCCVAHPSPACNDAACCDLVCNDDSFCCDTTWDQLCVASAQELCPGVCPTANNCGDAIAGSCFEAHDTPYCDDQACCDAVCAADSFCCDVQWDATCAEVLAFIFCDLPQSP